MLSYNLSKLAWKLQLQQLLLRDLHYSAKLQRPLEATPSGMESYGNYIDLKRSTLSRELKDTENVLEELIKEFTLEPQFDCAVLDYKLFLKYVKGKSSFEHFKLKRLEIHLKASKVYWKREELKASNETTKDCSCLVSMDKPEVCQERINMSSAKCAVYKEAIHLLQVDMGK